MDVEETAAIATGTIPRWPNINQQADMAVAGPIHSIIHNFRTTSLLYSVPIPDHHPEPPLSSSTPWLSHSHHHHPSKAFL